LGIGAERGAEPRDDSTLVDEARSGDRHAIERLLLLHYERVYALCRRMLGNDSDAEDATQDAFVAAVRALPRFDGRSTFATWMHRIATNTCIDEMRRRRRRPLLGLEEEKAPVTLAPDRSSEVAFRIDVDSALALVPSEFRAALVLRDVCDHSYEEIAQALEIPIGTVRSRIARGRAVLADLLGNSGSPSVVQGQEKAREEHNERSTTK
jgi:RNA polymerase sigma-70 factor (ECF subfamily)